jgi:hypothetical protein
VTIVAQDGIERRMVLMDKTEIPKQQQYPEKWAWCHQKTMAQTGTWN